MLYQPLCRQVESAANRKNVQSPLYQTAVEPAVRRPMSAQNPRHKRTRHNRHRCPAWVLGSVVESVQQALIQQTTTSMLWWCARTRPVCNRPVCVGCGSVITGCIPESVNNQVCQPGCAASCTRHGVVVRRCESRAGIKPAKAKP